MSHKTIKVYIAGLRLGHILRGLPDPTQDPVLAYTIRGIKRQQGDQPRTRLPITISILHRLKSQLQDHPMCLVDKRMLWAAFCTAFYGFLRSAEFTCKLEKNFDPDQALLRRDAKLQASGVLLELKTSKTDPFRHGITVLLAQTSTSTCPLSALSKYLAMTPDRSADLPLFQFASGDFLTRAALTRIIRDLLKSNDYASHSFRIGAATSAAGAGIPEWLIQVLGRWSSQCYQSYIKTPRATIQAALGRMAKSPCNC